MKRMCIYLVYDKQKIIDRYVGYMLQELKTCVDSLVVVYNEKIIVRGADILETYADEIYYRDNIGFDAGGFKDALCKFIGWERVFDYDELVLVNDSMFGPFRPMKEIFGEMNARSVDFWGLSKHGECEDKKLGSVKEHIQSFFLVISSKMLHCEQFRNYWENMPYFTTLVETVMQHEIKFTQYFAELGYTYDALADTKANDSFHIENNYLQYAMISYELIKKRNFPFLKRTNIPMNTLYCQTQENFRQAIDYIDKKTEYDVGLIWENIIRTMDMTDLQRSLHLQYIISLEKREILQHRTLIAVFANYRGSAEYATDYLMELPKDYDVKVFAGNGECFSEYMAAGFDCERIGERGYEAICEDFCGYEFVCVLHDADLTSDARPSCVGKSYFYHIWENLLKSESHIAGILNRFENEPYLGFLAAPQPNFAEYFGGYGRKWDGKFAKISAMIREMNLNCQISEAKEPFCVTNNFWIRSSCLQKLKAMNVKYMPYLNYIWIYLAQDAGYYSGIVESMDYASMNEVNLQYYLSRIIEEVRLKYGDFHTFFEMEGKLISHALKEFCREHSRIFIYGVGEIAQKYKDLVPKPESYLVSDGQPKPDKLYGIPVKYVSELVPSDEIGIVLCLNEVHQAQVIPLLREYGLKQYFCI